MAVIYEDISGSSISEVTNQILSDQIICSDQFLISQQSLSAVSPSRKYYWHGQILNNNYQSLKLDYHTLSNELFNTLSTEFGFKSMAWESSADYSLYGHVHHYSNLSVQNVLDEEEQISTLATFSVNGKKQSIHAPRISIPKQPKPYIGQLKFLAIKKLSVIDENATSFDGWVYPDGRAISRSKFKKAFDYFQTDYGNGDNETTFNIPLLRNFISMNSLQTNDDLTKNLVAEQQEVKVLKEHSHVISKLAVSGSFKCDFSFTAVGNTRAGTSCHARTEPNNSSQDYTAWFKVSNVSVKSGGNVANVSDNSETYPKFNYLPVLMYIGVD